MPLPISPIGSFSPLTNNIGKPLAIVVAQFLLRPASIKVNKVKKPLLVKSKPVNGSATYASIAAGSSSSHASSEEVIRLSSLLLSTIFITLAKTVFGLLGAAFAQILLIGSSTLVNGLSSDVPI